MDLVPPRSGRIAHALGAVRRTLEQALAAEPAAGPQRDGPPQARSAVGKEARSAVGRAPVPILLAWSGGPDSAALLGLVELLTRPLGLAIVVGHVDHGLRPASADEAALVVATARARGHAVLVDRLELASGPGLAARARDLRRAALVRQAQASGASVLVLGHTATDLAETMLLHLCRGAGLGGLSPMPSVRPWTDERDDADSAADPKPDASPRRPPSSTGILVRPLLHLTRTDTRALATELAIPFVDDPTNLDDAHPRVAIRERVLPILRAINPEIEAHFGALAHVARDAEQALAHAANELLDRALTEPDTLDVHVLRSVPRAVRVHAMRSFCLRRGVPPDALHERTLAAIEAVVAGEGREPARARRWDLHPHRTLSLAGGRLRLEPAQPPAHEPAPIEGGRGASQDALPRPGGPKRNGPNH